MAREQASLRFLIADDHPLFRDALRQTVAQRYPASAIEECASFDEVMGRLAAEDDVDLVLLDLAMPGMQRLAGLTYLRAQYPGVPVAIVSATEDPVTIRQAIALGASGYIPKSLATEVIGAAIAAVLDGAVWVPPDVGVAPHGEADDIAARLVTLTPQQLRVLMMLSQGLLNKQIAYELDVSEATVKAHVSAILQKLRVDSRTQAVIAASQISSGQWQSLAAGH